MSDLIHIYVFHAINPTQFMELETNTSSDFLLYEEGS